VLHWSLHIWLRENLGRTFVRSLLKASHRGEQTDVIWTTLSCFGRSELISRWYMWISYCLDMYILHPTQTNYYTEYTSDVCPLTRWRCPITLYICMSAREIFSMFICVQCHCNPTCVAFGQLHEVALYQLVHARCISTDAVGHWRAMGCAMGWPDCDNEAMTLISWVISSLVRSVQTAEISEYHYNVYSTWQNSSVSE
jgi:hypothetical protein